ncbi:12344_t:CDS:2 [Entrophospora sp. SA101]|nr:12344_t:CDS:2 [Entrophospora sp. SA101]CAJ0908558.1 15895_t:CDS:2 [Entrophospora sp. SA101]
MELINDLVVEETDNGNSELDEQIINSFSIDSWKEWKLKSGNRVIDILKNASNLNGHKLRQGSLDTMNKELETLRQRGPEASLQDPMNKFFCAILSDFNKFVYPNNALIQRGIDSESIYGVYVIHTCFKELFSGLENEILYKPGEAILSSVEMSRRQRKATNHYEQKADGVFLMCLNNCLLEVGHLEISGGYGHREPPRSTWDHVKGAVGAAYMLTELSQRYKKGNRSTFSKVQTHFVHVFENHIEIWQLFNPAHGVLLFERTYKAQVPINWNNHREYFFDFIVLLWNLRTKILETTKSILELHEEHNYNIFEENSPLYRGLPRTVTPCKDIHRDGINSICTESEPDS